MGEQRFEAIGSRGMLAAASAMIRLTRVAFGIANDPPDHEKAPLDDARPGFPDHLAVESLYADEVARLGRDGARLCELTRLAVDRAGDSMELLGTLFHVAYLYARRMGDATHLLAEVNPRHVRFYSRMLGFRIAGPLRTCRRVDAPAVMIALSLDHAAGEIARFSAHPELARVRRSLYPYFLPTGEEGRIIARLFGTDRAQGGAGLPMALHT